ncbi:Copia protein [Symbiodinium microadriaticum]|uniref:Copia protein n=2 Tax=Symbiodinium TaxID=2949 RepID=A0A1Q9ESL8_SYMMI|nr:Copia protein [Symbiodinium microadriaticum]
MATSAPLLGKEGKKAAHSKASIFYGADEYLEELKKKYEHDHEIAALKNALPGEGDPNAAGVAQSSDKMLSVQKNNENRSLKTNRLFPTPNKPDPMPQNLAFLFTKITPDWEQMIYMWNVLTAIFFTQVLMVIGYCAALACFPDFWWTCTLCFGIPFAYIAIQNIYIDHDVMHGATFPVYEWQRFLTHPFADFFSLPWEEFVLEHNRHHASTVDLLIQGEFGWDPEEFHYALQQWAGPWGSNWYKYLLTVPFIPVIHFFGLNDTGSLFALEWWMHFPDEGAGWRFMFTVSFFARVGYSAAWMFITNFTHSLPWNEFLAQDPGRTWPVLHNVMAMVLGGKHRWNEMLFHDAARLSLRARVHHAFPNAVGTLSQRGRFHGWEKVHDAAAEVLHHGLWKPNGDEETQMQKTQKKRSLMMKLRRLEEFKRVYAAVALDLGQRAELCLLLFSLEEPSTFRINECVSASDSTAYGAVQARADIVSGVPAEQRVANSLSTSMDQMMENPNAGDMMLPVDGAAAATMMNGVVPQPHSAEPPYEGEPERNGSAGSEVDGEVFRVFTINGIQRMNVSPPEDLPPAGASVPPVQRQLEEYKAKQQSEVERLQQEIRVLKEERMFYNRVPMYQGSNNSFTNRVLVYLEEDLQPHYRVRMYQGSINIYLYRVPMYQEANHSFFSRVLVYQEGNNSFRSRVLVYQEGISSFLSRVLVYQEGISGFLSRVPVYLEGNNRFLSRVLVYQVGNLSNGKGHQAAMLKQMDKSGGEEKGLETIKPGQAVLPLLPEVNGDTACCDVMDWLEVINGPMSDLSDHSAVWWRKVTSEANRAYATWSLASPLEKLAVVPDVTGLEVMEPLVEVESYFKHLIAECEEGQKPGTPKGEVPCRFFGKTAKGCIRGNKCPFLHSWEGLDKKERCLNCGGKGHLAKECPVKKTPPSSSGNTPKNDKNNQGGTSSTATRTVRIDDKPEVNPLPASSGEATSAQADLKEVLVDVGKVLKAMQATTMKSLKVEPPQKGNERHSDEIAKEIQAAMLKKSEVSLGVQSEAVDSDEIAEEIQAAMLKKSEVSLGVQSEAVDSDEIAEEIQAAMLKKSEVSNGDIHLGRSLPEGSKEVSATPDGLLDSGASHPKRTATSVEYQEGCPVSVTLAGEDIRVLRQNNQGTILIDESQGPVQSIVPLGALIQDLGYTLNWGPKHLKLTHPVKGPIKVKINNNCPEVAASDALTMIRELEMSQVNQLNKHVETLKARLEVLKLEEKRDWPELMKEYLNNGKRGSLLKAILKCPFTKDLPSDVQSLMLEDFAWDDGSSYLRSLPLTRKKRKSLLNSDNWVVCLFMGESDNNDPFRMIPMSGKVVLEVDMARSKLWNFHAPMGVFRLLLWAAPKGKIADVVSSLPDRTWHAVQTPRRGPDACPLRTTRAPYGRKDLNQLQQQQVHSETACVAKQMLLWLLATMAGKGNVGFLMELHADPVAGAEGGQQFATLWKTEMWRAFKSVAGMANAAFNMGSHGHRATRPTVVATNYPAVVQLNGNYEGVDGCIPASLLTRAEVRKWSVAFKHLVMESSTDFHAGKWAEKDELVDLGVKLTKLTREQRQEWKNHLLNDHQAYRADCAVCINAQANGYQHRRRRHPHLYTLAMDVAGPFVTRGRDMEYDDYKYMLIASYRCPRDYLKVKGIKEEDRELYVPDDDEEDQGDDSADPLRLGEEEPGLGEEVESEVDGDEVPFGPKTLDEDAKELMEPIETSTVYLARPLRRRTTSAVLMASKEIMLQLRQSGLHVDSIHTDRAREFSSKAFKAWATDSELRHTKSAGADPSGNSTAELGVKWVKQRVRALLKAGKAEAKDWPMAMHHAVSSLWARCLPDTPWSMPPVAPFGSEVWFRAKTYKGTKEKKQEAADVRWKRGWYRGPAKDVSRGHLIQREDGGLVIAKGVKYNVKDPTEQLRDLLPPLTAEGLEVQEADLRYQTKKELKDEIEFTAKYLMANENYDLKEVLKLYNKLEELGDTDLRIGKKTAVTSWYTGAFVHGGCAGVRKNLINYPHTSKYLVKVAKQRAGGQPFSALGIARNATLGMHRDVRNWRDSKNMVVPLTTFTGGSLWVHDPGVEEEDSENRVLPNGQQARGRVKEMEMGKTVEFRPTEWHEVQPWEGDRVVLLMYTPRATKLSQGDVDMLVEFGFEVPLEARKCEQGEVEEDQIDPGGDLNLRALRANFEEEQMAFIEVEDEDIFDGIRDERGPQLKRLACSRACNEMTRILKKAEVQYTSGIEEILRKCEDENQVLDVTHSVSLQEVKGNLSAWRASALKEYGNLKDNKRAFDVCKRDQLPSGCRIVPCKGVYTVKPDKDNLYRRKTRFVACGNHVPEGQEGMDLFAAGLDATTLRTMLAYTKGKKWCYGTTDIRQAFVLAPWLGQAVALQPPSIAYELGIAEPGDYWLVRMSIYGLRESPALWSKYRNEQLQGARWKAEVEGKEEELRLIQLVTDDQVWKIVRVRGDQEPLGYIMVYVDDLLVNAQSSAMSSFYEWLAARWECDNLDVLQPGHPIRFLGMEMHMVEDGIELAQEGFVRELLRAHGHDGSRAKTQGPKDTMVLSLEEEQAIILAEPADLTGKETEVKMAQRRVGELLWLAGRTRPDIQYVTALLSSRITRCPEIVNKVGERMLSYLNETIHFRLRFEENKEPEETLRVYTDSSFAPSSGRSHGAAGVFVNNNPVAWRSSRQQLVTLSTAESELLEAVEGTVLASATSALLEELKGKRIYRQLEDEALKELQRLLALEPGSLSDEQGERLFSYGANGFDYECLFSGFLDSVAYEAEDEGGVFVKLVSSGCQETVVFLNSVTLKIPGPDEEELRGVLVQEPSVVSASGLHATLQTLSTGQQRQRLACARLGVSILDRHQVEAADLRVTSGGADTEARQLLLEVQGL